MFARAQLDDAAHGAGCEPSRDAYAIAQQLRFSGVASTKGVLAGVVLACLLLQAFEFAGFHRRLYTRSGRPRSATGAMHNYFGINVNGFCSYSVRLAFPAIELLPMRTNSLDA